MKDSGSIEKQFYIKVNKKKSSANTHKSIDNTKKNQSEFLSKNYSYPKNIFFTESKNGNKHFLSPINKDIEYSKLEINNNKILKENNSNSSINEKYQRKIIHIDSGNKINICKSQTFYPLNNKNNSRKNETDIKKIITYFSPKNINIQKINASKKINHKGKSDLRAFKKYLINYEQNSSNSGPKLLSNLKSNKRKNSFYNINLKKIKINNDNNNIIKKEIFNRINYNRNFNDLLRIPKYYKTIINNSSQNNKKKKKIIKKPKYKSRENSNNNSNDNNQNKKMINIYLDKLVAIFVKLMMDFYRKQLKKLFNIFIYQLKVCLYFMEYNNTYNLKKRINNISENRIYDYNSKIKYKNNYGYNLKKSLISYKDYQSMAIYPQRFGNIGQNISNTTKNNKYKHNIENNEYSDYNYLSNQKYNIFDNMKIPKTTKIFEENSNNLYKSQKINTQINNNYFNTKNTNFYFNKINCFNSLIIEKQRPRHFFPKETEKKENKKEIREYISLKKNKNININMNKPKINMKYALLNTEKKTKNFIYKKILSKDKEKKINKDKKLINQKEKTFSNKNIIHNNKELINVYSTVNQNIKDSYNNEDISNDMNNYCLEDIDKPMNIIYLRSSFEENENYDNNEINHLLAIKTNDKRLFLNFNYIIMNKKKKGKAFIYKNNNEIKKYELMISYEISIFYLNKYKKNEENENIYNKKSIKQNEPIINRK